MYVIMFAVNKKERKKGFVHLKVIRYNLAETVTDGNDVNVTLCFRGIEKSNWQKNRHPCSSDFLKNI